MKRALRLAIVFFFIFAVLPCEVNAAAGAPKVTKIPTALPNSPNHLAISPSFESPGRTQSSALIRTPPTIRKLTKKFFRSDEAVTLEVTNTQDQKITVDLVDTEGKKANVSMDKTQTTNEVSVNFAPKTQFRPGKYKLIVTDSEGKKSEQDFFWGVLAINTDRSIYQPGQKAKIAIGVLDDKGNMVCDAKVELKITHPTAPRVDTLSTENGKIVTNKQCTSHNFSLEPDYETSYEVDTQGVYEMSLTAETAHGSYTITDSFTAKGDVPFDVKRISSTRIYPPTLYPVTLNITANQDFDGMVTETVPESFAISPTEADTTYDSAQTLYLEKKDDPANTVLGAMTGPSASDSALALPFSGSYAISQGFGAVETVNVLSKFYQNYSLSGHDGIDFALPENTPVFATDDGNVVFAGDGDYGITVVLQHTWGKSYYGHLDNVTVENNISIKKGQQIGFSGNTGESTGPHLHFAIKPNNPDMTNGYFGKVDPLPYFNLPKTSLLATNDQAIGVLGASTKAPTATAAATFDVLEDQLRKEVLTNPTEPAHEKVKIIQWHVSLKKGEQTKLSYQFKAPNISPQFYLLGPLRFYSHETEPVFAESRQWQIAADALGTGWYNNGTPYGGYSWQYRKQITIDSTKVSSTQTNFPVLINEASDTELAEKAQTDGDDILFTDSTGQTKLSHEIERYTSATGELIAWVKIPNLSASTNTAIYLYYGNEAATNQEDVPNVWSNNYVSVWHLREDPTTTCNSTHEFCDSVASNDGDAQGSMTAADRITGQIGYGTDLDGLNDYISTTTSYNDPQNLTVSTWLKTTSVAGRKVVGFENTQTGTGSQAYDRHIFVNTSGKAVAGSYDGEPPDRAVSTATVTTGTWQYVVGEMDNTNDLLSVFVNGATPQTVASSFAQSATGYWRIGSYKLAGWTGGSDGYYAGQVDEVHVANGIRSQGWITTEYNNQSSPSTFYSLGGEETKIYSASLDHLMRHGQFFNSSGVVQPFVF